MHRGASSLSLGDDAKWSVVCDDCRFIGTKESRLRAIGGRGQMFSKQALRHYEVGWFAIAAHAVCPVDRESLLLHAMSCKGIVLHGLACVYASLLVDLPPEGGTVGCTAYMVALQCGIDLLSGKLRA